MASIDLSSTPAFSAKVPPEKSQTILLVTITVDPSDIDEFLKGLHICYDRCVEEPECLSFEVFHSQDSPGRFRFLEIWAKDREWFESVQMKKPYYDPYHEATIKLWTEPRTLEFFDRQPGLSAINIPRDPLFIEYDTPISVYHTSSLESDAPPVTLLSKEETDCLLDLYWPTFEIEIPILDPISFRAQYECLWSKDGQARSSPPLVDALTALASQHAQSADLMGRTVGTRHLRCMYHGDVGLASFCYLRRCRKTLEQDVSEPSLTKVQTYAFMTAYLLNAGQYETAYTMLGVAIRLGYLLDIHVEREVDDEEPPVGDWVSRTWWFLIHLDLRCSLELGRPLAVHWPGLPPSKPPSATLATTQYHISRARLTAAILSALDTLMRNSPATPRGGNVIVSLDAESLEKTLRPLEQWKQDTCHDNEPFYLRLNTAQDEITRPRLRTVGWERQSTLLSLYYHDAIRRFFQPFVTVFLSESQPPQLPRNLGQVSLLAKKGADHAMAIIDIIHDGLRSSDALYGCFELYVLEWNALLSIFALTMACPSLLPCSLALEKLERASLLFELGEKRHAVAKRAWILTQRLRTQLLDATRSCAAKSRNTDNGLQAEAPVNALLPTDPESVSLYTDQQWWQEESAEDVWSWLEDFGTTDSWESECLEIDGLLNTTHSLPSIDLSTSDRDHHPQA
ncbi:Fungal specific transcription factor domain-containing protein [Cladophialophora immunda]|nr:Fungal specific transcription factor domain-containing protein [Cladophialophora immunda]